MHCGWECKLVRTLWKQYGISKKLKIELPYDPAILLWVVLVRYSISWMIFSLGMLGLAEKGVLRNLKHLK